MARERIENAEAWGTGRENDKKEGRIHSGESKKDREPEDVMKRGGQLEVMAEVRKTGNAGVAVFCKVRSLA